MYSSAIVVALRQRSPPINAVVKGKKEKSESGSMMSEKTPDFGTEATGR